MEKQEDRRGKGRGQRGGKRSTRKEKKDDIRGRGETKEEEGRKKGRRRRTRQRRNPCCYLSADDLKRGRATENAAALAKLAPRS